VSTAMIEVRAAAEQLATEQEQRLDSARRVSDVVSELGGRLEELTRLASENGAGVANGAAPESGSSPPRS
jgi:hypothetical protein